MSGTDVPTTQEIWGWKIRALITAIAKQNDQTRDRGSSRSNRKRLHETLPKVLENALRAAGAVIQSAVNARTDWLLCESRDSTSTKARAARSLLGPDAIKGYDEIFV